MISNYFKIAIRILSRHKTYVFLNIAGLGFALACCLLAYLNYDYRETFDANYPDTENIYRINSKRISDGVVNEWGVSPIGLGEALKKNSSSVTSYARLFSAAGVIKNANDVFSEQIHFADPAFFDLFSVPLSEGNSSQFAAPNNVIISQTLAKKLFGNQSALNREITLINRQGMEQPFLITAVLGILPQNSSFQFDVITSIDTYFSKADQINISNNREVSTFLEIPNKTSLSNVEHQASSYAALYNKDKQKEKIEGFKLQNFQNIAFSSDRDLEGYVYGSTLNQNPRGVIVFGPAIMSFLILLIACFNFTNISISFASTRLKEIGIRKILGGIRAQLIKQFLAENILLCVLASGLAVFFVIALLPSFNSVSGLSLSFNFKDLSLYLFLFSLPLFTALVSGLYPSLYISSFKPISILKGQTTFGDSNVFTKVLLCAQFSLTCFALIIGISLTKNAYYQSAVDYGYAINELAVLEVDSLSEFNILNNTLKSNPQIKSIAGTVNQIGEGSPVLKVEAGNKVIDATVTTTGGESYLKTSGVMLKEGRYFYSNRSMDPESSVMVNESLLSALNIKSAVGHRIKVDSTLYTIVGVVKDYKESGLHGEVPPIILKLANPENFRYLTVRADKASLPGVYKKMKDTWHRALPGKPFRGFMQNELIEKELYMNEGMKSVSFFLAITTIALSASGIFALISLNIIRRKREIGMRKVLGASILSIISLLNKSYFRLMMLSFVIGSAIGFLLIDNLLFRFIYAYHAEIGVMPFILTLSILLITTAITIGNKVYKTAVSSPIKTLKEE